ncbi:alpha/beta-hydrolase [Xylariaceae sp. FL0804]|nr:alpha/beta-hydrolase [Xylariaceae sp. FL0804]
MKPFSCALISALALSATAKPLGDSSFRLAGREENATTTEVDNLKFYAQYAAAAYCNAEVDDGTAIACSNNTCPDVESAGATVTATYSGILTDAKGFVAVDDTNGLIVVSVQGSTSIRNWLTDFTFLQISCDFVDSCLVHEGFATAWDEVSDDVLAALATATADNPSYAIVYTGHSLGAAVATLAAAYGREAGYAGDLYTYGSPRVGNGNLVAFITDQAGGEYRVTHLDDPVPRLPPIILNYAHTSPEYWLDDGEATTTDYTTADIEVCTGYKNTSCNAGTSGLDGTAHDYYFEYITGCGADGISFKFARDLDLDRRVPDPVLARRNVTYYMGTGEPQDLTDAELEAQLNDWVAQDIAATSS